MYLITQRSEHYVTLRDTVLDQTLFNVALLNTHGVTARHTEGKQ